jgi:hypothetical protein
MPLFDRKSKKLAYSLGCMGQLSLMLFTFLILSNSFVHWFFRGAVFESAKQRYDDEHNRSMMILCLGAVGTGLTGIKIIDRTED